MRVGPVSGKLVACKDVVTLDEFNAQYLICTCFSILAEIDRCLKKVNEGVEAFDDIWQKVNSLSCRCVFTGKILAWDGPTQIGAVFVRKTV